MEIPVIFQRVRDCHPAIKILWTQDIGNGGFASLDFAGARRDKTGDQAEQSGFAGRVGAAEADQPARRQAEVQVAQHLAGAITLAYAFQAQQCPAAGLTCLGPLDWPRGLACLGRCLAPLGRMSLLLN